MSLTPDFEITMMRRFCHDLAQLQPDARQRVLAYVSARIDSLPVLAAVGGGTEEDADETEKSDMFKDVPMMPQMKGAA